MSTNIADEILSLRRSDLTDDAECSAEEIMRAVIALLEDVTLKDESQSDLLFDWEERINTARCEVLGGHEFEYDQCGYWGHKYCYLCGLPQYPELHGLRCSEAVEKTGRATEDEYQAAKGGG